MNIKLVADGIKHPSEDITEFGSLIVECNFFCRYKSMSVIVCLTFTKHNFVIVVIHEENFTICKITPYSKWFDLSLLTSSSTTILQSNSNTHRDALMSSIIQVHTENPNIPTFAAVMTALQLSVIAPRNFLVALRKHTPIPSFRSAEHTAMLAAPCITQTSKHKIEQAICYIINFSSLSLLWKSTYLHNIKYLFDIYSVFCYNQYATNIKTKTLLPPNVSMNKYNFVSFLLLLLLGSKWVKPSIFPSTNLSVFLIMLG